MIFNATMLVNWKNEISITIHELVNNLSLMLYLCLFGFPFTNILIYTPLSLSHNIVCVRARIPPFVRFLGKKSYYNINDLGIFEDCTKSALFYNKERISKLKCSLIWWRVTLVSRQKEFVQIEEFDRYQVVVFQQIREQWCKFYWIISVTIFLVLVIILSD